MESWSLSSQPASLSTGQLGQGVSKGGPRACWPSSPSTPGSPSRPSGRRRRYRRPRVGAPPRFLRVRQPVAVVVQAEGVRQRRRLFRRHCLHRGAERLLRLGRDPVSRVGHARIEPLSCRLDRRGLFQQGAQARGEPLLLRPLSVDQRLQRIRRNRAEPSRARSASKSPSTRITAVCTPSTSAVLSTWAPVFSRRARVRAPSRRRTRGTGSRGRSGPVACAGETGSVGVGRLALAPTGWTEGPAGQRGRRRCGAANEHSPPPDGVGKKARCSIGAIR